MSSGFIGKMGLGMVEVQCGKEVSSFAICKETLGCGSPERAELYAALTAIQRAPQDRERIILHTDSWVVWHFSNVIRKKYYLIGFEGLPNSDIYLDLEHAFRGLEARSVQLFVFKVKGHCGNIYNEKCDLIAKAALSRNSSKKKRKTSAATSEGQNPDLLSEPGMPEVAKISNTSANCRRGSLRDGNQTAQAKRRPR